MIVSNLGQIQPQDRNAAIIATALTKNPVKLGAEASPTAMLVGIALGIGALAYIIAGND